MEGDHKEIFVRIKVKIEDDKLYFLTENNTNASYWLIPQAYLIGGETLNINVSGSNYDRNNASINVTVYG